MTHRFKLAFHREMKELPVYALSVGKTGPKLAKSGGDPNGPPELDFGALGNLHVTNASMASFTQAMQAIVPDRPVVDQTGLEGRFDFDLNWTPDDSQFAGLGAKIPPPADGANAPPLYKAIQEQIGLKLDATKAPAEVLVIDHVEKPSENSPPKASDLPADLQTDLRLALESIAYSHRCPIRYNPLQTFLQLLSTGFAEQVRFALRSYGEFRRTMQKAARAGSGFKFFSGVVPPGI